jgi:putative membrane protein
MRTWMKVLSLAVVLAVVGDLRADDDKKRTGDKPTRTDDKPARTDDRRSDDKRTDDRRTDDRHDDKRSDDKKFTDTHFVDHAYTSGQNEVIMNRMALQRSQNEDVRKFAQKLIEDHSKANQELTLIVSESRIAVPDRPLPEQEKDMRHLSSNEVKNFDKEFMDHMVMSHEKGIKLFEQGSKELKNEKLKEFATKTLPTLKEHLKLAKETRDKVAKGDRGGDRGGDRNNRDDK